MALRVFGPAQDATFESKTEIVRLDTVVRDSAGRAVTDLRSEDFEVREDGVLQRIVHFQRLSTNPVPAPSVSGPTVPLPDRGPSAADRDARTPPPRHLVFAVDDLHLGTSSLLVARREVAALLDGKLEADDDEPGSAPERARVIVQENARYNIGTREAKHQHTDAASPLPGPPEPAPLLVRAGGPPSCRWARGRGDPFAENARPTLIRDGGSGADLPAEGSFWIDPGRGTVLRTLTRFRFGPDRGSGEITTEYRREPALRMWVPSEMAERYEDRGAPSAGLGSSTSSVARYSNFRQFSVTIEDESATLPKASEAVPPR